MYFHSPFTAMGLYLGWNKESRDYSKFASCTCSWLLSSALEFVATVPHRSCGYVDKLSDRKIVNISSVTRDGLHLAIQVLNNLSSQRERNLNSNGILKRVAFVIPSFWQCNVFHATLSPFKKSWGEYPNSSNTHGDRVLTIVTDIVECDVKQQIKPNQTTGRSARHFH